MIRDQCKTFCRCSYCEQQKGRQGHIPGSTRLRSCAGRSVDELYLRTLNESLRAKSLMASSKNAHKFKPDEMLQSTRGEMARAALTVPVRRRDRLQELLILENKERIKAERQLRRDRRAAGLPDEDMDATRDCAVGTQDDFPDVTVVEQTNDACNIVQPACSAEEDLYEALQTIKDITDDHATGGASKPLTSEHVTKLRRLVRKQDDKTKKMIADCPLQPHTCGHCFAVNVQGKHTCQLPPPQLVTESMLPSLHGSTTRRFNYDSHPYGSGVVWLPIDPKGETCVSGKRGSTEAADKADAEYQYPGSTYNKYHHSTKAPADTAAREAVSPAAGEPNMFDESGNSIKGADAVNGKTVCAEKTVAATEPLQYKSTAALWRTTNQEREAQAKHFLEFKKLQGDASRVYAEGAIKRRVNA
ncbi:hypothetical protein DQ04_01541000 [Trypanosoma grayi]|uniref:hypothetical protein n=1 Tax=Trypanosoma grayi TaxID=71804 RepID=UPI0004F3EF5D|nr:hypothetical protein DQ04_01541000 [Trypanosoma grayi]KEG12660.1 hypothetical protein DQ04_01541000 [Trypanosoma grayi]